MISILLLVAFFYIAYRLAPRERQEDAHVHGAGQIGLLAAVALFGVDYFTSFYYASGEMMGALHPYGLQNYAYWAVLVIAIANFVFGALYMYSLGVFNEGGGSFTAAMRYLGPALSLIVAVVLIQDYIFTIVVSSLSGVDQLLSLRNATGIPWYWHVLIGFIMVAVTWYLTIRGRGESAQVVFTLLVVFFFMTILMAAGLVIAHYAGTPPSPDLVAPEPASLSQAIYHMLTASMKGLVALSGLEAMSNGIQFVFDKDVRLVAWGKKHLPKWKSLWNFYSGKSGIGRFVQTSFLFYGGLTTLLLTVFSIRFNVFNGTAGRSLVGNLAFIGFGTIPNGTILFGAYQILAVVLLAAASMTAYQDLQAMAWRNVAIGEIPEIVVYRNIYPASDGRGDCRDHYPRFSQGRGDVGCSVLWSGCLLANHGNGIGYSKTHFNDDDWPAAFLGRIGRQYCSHIGGNCLRWTDCRQVARRGMGCPHLPVRTGLDRSRHSYLTCGI
jgi:hypothetical protein